LRRAPTKAHWIWSLLVLILVYWVMRNIRAYPFTLLAPHWSGAASRVPIGRTMPQWHYTQYGQQQAPVEQEQLLHLLAAGQVGASDLVWTEGMANWLPPGQVRQLSQVTAPPAYAYPAAQPAYPPAQPLGYQSAPTPIQYVNYGTAAPASGHASLATVAMVLGCCSFVVGGFFTGIAALICGWIALNGMKRTGNYQNKGFAIAGAAVP
jgi:hypothetical protein